MKFNRRVWSEGEKERFADGRMLDRERACSTYVYRLVNALNVAPTDGRQIKCVCVSRWCGSCLSALSASRVHDSLLSSRFIKKGTNDTSHAFRQNMNNSQAKHEERVSEWVSETAREKWHKTNGFQHIAKMSILRVGWDWCRFTFKTGNYIKMCCCFFLDFLWNLYILVAHESHADSIDCSSIFIQAVIEFFFYNPIIDFYVVRSAVKRH